MLLYILKLCFVLEKIALYDLILWNLETSTDVAGVGDVSLNVICFYVILYV